MSCEEKLRQQAGFTQSKDRDALLQKWAKECVEDFMERCETVARFQKALSFTNTAINGQGPIRAYPDDKCTAELMTSGRAIKLSEAEKFQSYIEAEFKKHDLQSAQVLFHQAHNTLWTKGLFGSRKKVVISQGYYEFTLSMSWRDPAGK